MDEHAPEHDNDTRGWVLVHDQIRATLAAAPDHVRALRQSDALGARTLAAWWLSFSRSFAHHVHTEDGRIWPALGAADPAVSPDLVRLTDDHHRIVTELRALDAVVATLPRALPTAGFPAAQRDVLDRLERLQLLVTRHLDDEERTAFVAGREHVDEAEWGRIERDMVKGLSLKDVSTLLPRILEQADAADKAMMLGRLPAPVRLLDERVFEPRYQRIRSRLPGS